MPHQYKQEPLSDDEVNRLTNVCEILEGRFIILPLFNNGKVSFGGSVFH
jgi:integrase/recombinase XerD